MADPEQSAEEASHRAPRLDRGPLCGGATDVGTVRERNEDAFWISGDASALIVADGLGGLPAGDVASTLAVDAASAFLEHARLSNGHGHTDSDARSDRHAEDADVGRMLGERAAAAAAEAQRTLLEASRRHAQLRGMATTLVIVLVEARTATVLQIGDSRAALCRGGRLVRETVDHNYAGEMVREGVLTPEEARRHPSRNLVREVVGLPGGYEAEIQTWSLEPGDVVLAFTDGVSETVTAGEIARILEDTTDAGSAASALIGAAIRNGGHDNATAIVRYVT